MSGTLAAFLAFQVVWVVTALGAAAGHAWPGVVAALIAVAWYVLRVGQPARALVVVLAAAGIGAVGESLLTAFGFVRYAASWPSTALAPVWIVTLWAAFAVTLAPTRNMLGHRWIIASALLGLLLAPLSYVAGERLGALTLAVPLWHAWLAIGALWGVAYPLVLVLDKWLMPSPAPAPRAAAR